MPWEALRWIIAERMGWTLDYVDGLDVSDIVQAFETWRGQNVAGR